MTQSEHPYEDLRRQLVELIADKAYERREEAFRLSSGAMSHDYVDVRRGISSGGALRLAADAVVAAAEQEGITFEAVGGLTMGADPLSHAVALVTGKAWFSVRKEAKGHGKQNLVEGCEIRPGMEVLVVEDTLTTGGSIERALDAVEELRAKIVLAVALVDRGDAATERMEKRGVRYKALVTYRDLGIEPVVPA